jgi:3-hydroxy acid dehydrogenase / malonic semialdehyde reductase
MKQTIVITGASRGIGKCITERLLQQGEKILMLSRNIDAMEKIAAEYPHQAFPYQVDLSNLEALEKVMAQLCSDFPQIDSVIHNAGSGLFGNVEALDFSEWQKQLDLNLNAAVRITQKVLPQMKNRKKGQILFINSIAAEKVFPGGAAYGVSKAGLKMFADTLREELRPYHIGVSSLFPAATATDWWNGSPFPKEEMMPPESIAAAVEFILNQSFPVVVEEITLRRVQGDF